MTKYVFLDTETTGLDPHKGKKSNKGAFRVHGILDEELVGLPNFKDIHERFINFVKSCHLIIFKAEFDLKFLYAELNRLNYPSTVSDICAEVTCAME